MNHLFPDNDRPADRASALGPESPEIAQARTRTLAMIAGHIPLAVSQAPGELPRLASTADDEIDRQDTVLDALPEAKRWDPIPGSEGQQAAESPSDEEDAEGRSATEQLFDDGAEAADRERMRLTRAADPKP